MILSAGAILILAGQMPPYNAGFADAGFAARPPANVETTIARNHKCRIHSPLASTPAFQPGLYFRPYVGLFCSVHAFACRLVYQPIGACSGIFPVCHSQPAKESGSCFSSTHQAT